MTEDESLVCTDPQKMLAFLQGQVSERKLRHFAVSCWYREATRLQKGAADSCLVRADKWADGVLHLAELTQFLEDKNLWLTSLTLTNGTAAEVAECAVSHSKIVAYNTGLDPDHEELCRGMEILPNWDQPRCHVAVQEERRIQALCLRDIFGPLPFCPVPTIDRSVLTWNDGTVRRIAEGIYADRAFDRMPILHDALLDAGCADEALLSHCRNPKGHIRGCWVVDLLLGKE